MLTNEEIVLLKLYEFIEIKHEPIYYSKLIEETKLEEKIVSRIEDKLMDLCMIDAEFTLINNKWVRIYHISNSYICFIESLYKSCKNVSN